MHSATFQRNHNFCETERYAERVFQVEQVRSQGKSKMIWLNRFPAAFQGQIPQESIFPTFAKSEYSVHHSFRALGMILSVDPVQSSI